MDEEEFLFARRVLQRQWLPREQVMEILQERKGKSGRDRGVPVWDLMVERKWLTPTQVGEIRHPHESATALPSVPEVELQDPVDRDGLGTRYRGRWLKDNRVVEVRWIPAPLAAHGPFRRRFLERGATLCGLPEHPVLARTLRVGEAGDALYRISEWIEGEHLGETLTRLETVPESACLEIAADAVEGLVLLRDRRLAHGDLKPGDLVSPPTGRTRMREAAVAPATVEELAAGAAGVAWSPVYRSPERLRGESGACFADDVYALGACLYHLAVGEVPFPGETPEDIADRILTEDPGDPRAVAPDLTEGFADLLRRMLARDPAQRFPDPRELRQAIAALAAPAAGGRAPARRRPGSSPGRAPAAGVRRWPAPRALAIFVGVFLLTLLLLWRASSGGAPEQQPPAEAPAVPEVAPSPPADPPGTRVDVPQRASREAQTRELATRPWRSCFDGRTPTGWTFPAGVWHHDEKKGTMRGQAASGPAIARHGSLPTTPLREVEVVLTPSGDDFAMLVPTAAGDLAWRLSRSESGVWQSRVELGGAEADAPRVTSAAGVGRWVLLVGIYDERTAQGLLFENDREAVRWEISLPEATAAPGDVLRLEGSPTVILDRVRMK